MCQSNYTLCDVIDHYISSMKEMYDRVLTDQLLHYAHECSREFVYGVYLLGGHLLDEYGEKIYSVDDVKITIDSSDQGKIDVIFSNKNHQRVLH